MCYYIMYLSFFVTKNSCFQDSRGERRSIEKILHLMYIPVSHEYFWIANVFWNFFFLHLIEGLETWTQRQYSITPHRGGLLFICGGHPVQGNRGKYNENLHLYTHIYTYSNIVHCTTWVHFLYFPHKIPFIQNLFTLRHGSTIFYKLYHPGWKYPFNVSHILLLVIKILIKFSVYIIIHLYKINLLCLNFINVCQK
jgi:hypothetical protein